MNKLYVTHTVYIKQILKTNLRKINNSCEMTFMVICLL